MQTNPTRAAALARLAAFAPRMGMAYATGRNADPGPGGAQAVSALSPFIRQRLITEAEAVGTALAHHSPQRAEKFIQEVFWRTYWKGWLEQRPGVWAAYRDRVAEETARHADNPAYLAACVGQSGIACFDAWAEELRDTGWLHNHTRMWFASIWIFSLRLPWVLGADLFLRHLLDGDAASNTLSWRWVAGSQTKGKHYLARAENIARNTEGRFNPVGQLDEDAAPIVEPDAAPLVPLPLARPQPEGAAALLLHGDDLHPESLALGDITAVAGLALAPQGASPAVVSFGQAALADGLARAAAHFGVPAVVLTPQTYRAWVAAQGRVVTPVAPVGWTADALAGLPLHPIRRDWDQACWPHATRGFFPFREKIPGLIQSLKPAAP